MLSACAYMCIVCFCINAKSMFMRLFLPLFWAMSMGLGLGGPFNLLTLIWG